MGNEKKSGWDKGWTQPKSPVTDELVNRIGNTLTDLIESSQEGSWTGKIRDIMDACGEKDEEEYGTYFNALPTARERFCIQSKSAGRNGNKYYLISSTSTTFSNQQPSLPKMKISLSIECPGLSEPYLLSFSIIPEDGLKNVKIG